MKHAIDLMTAGAIFELRKEAGRYITEGEESVPFDPEESKDLKACIDALSSVLRSFYLVEKSE